MHFHKFLFSCTHYQKWFYDAILRGSPHLLGNSIEVPCDMHTAQPPAHTLVLGLSRQPAAAIWWEIISCQEKACVWFDPSVRVTGVELKSPPFCSGLAWALVSCAVVPLSLGPETFWAQEWIPWPCQALIQGFFVATTSSSFIASGFSFCVFVSEAQGMVSPPDPRRVIRFRGNQLISRSPRSPTHDQVHDVQVQKWLRIWKSQQQSMAARTGSF